MQYVEFVYFHTILCVRHSTFDYNNFCIQMKIDAYALKCLFTNDVRRFVLVFTFKLQSLSFSVVLISKISIWIAKTAVLIWNKNKCNFVAPCYAALSAIFCSRNWYMIKWWEISNEKYWRVPFSIYEYNSKRNEKRGRRININSMKCKTSKGILPTMRASEKSKVRCFP